MVPGEYQLRVSRRARRLRIDVSAHRGVVVVVPEGTPEAAVQEFVRAKRGWVRRARERVRADAEVLRAPDETVPRRLQLRALGLDFTVETVAAGDRRRVERQGDRVRVTGAEDPAAVRTALTGWLKRLARRRLLPRLAELSRQHGLEYERAAVRGQRTRWGSCSGRGTISLNYKLLFLPPALVDHVLVHELAHTRHLDHSPRFWALLAHLDPDWRAHHEALKAGMEWLPAWVEMEP